MSELDRRTLLGAARRTLDPSPEDKARNARALAAKLGVAVGAAAAGQAASTAAPPATSTAASVKAGLSAAAKVGLSAKAVLGLKVIAALALTSGMVVVALDLGSPAPVAAPVAASSTSLAVAASSAPAADLQDAPMAMPTLSPAPTPSTEPVLVAPPMATTAPAGATPSVATPPSASAHVVSQPSERVGSAKRSEAATTGITKTPVVTTTAGPGTAGTHEAPPSEPRSEPRPATSAPMTEEIVLVRAIHSALAERNFARAVALADEYGRRFPQGVLSLEVEGLRVVAQCQAAPSSAARALASDFAARHPRAPMVDRVRAACGTE